jgi:hypothetical protein
MTKLTSNDPRVARGRARMKEIADEMRHEVAILSEAMCRGLGRPATELEKLQSEAISGLFLKARRLRDQGKNDIEYLREAAIMTSQSVFRHPLDISPHRVLVAEPGAFEIQGAATFERGEVESQK